MKDRILKWLTDEQDPKHLRAIATSIAAFSTYFGAIAFFRSAACSQSAKIPWLGVILLVGGLAATFIEVALYAERAAQGDKTGTRIAVITLFVLFGFFIFGMLFILKLSCPE